MIGELPLVRLRQVTAAIEMRRWAKHRQEMSSVAWQTRTLASFIAAGYMTDGENPAIEAAGKIAFDELEATLMEESIVQKVDKESEWTPDMPSEAKDNGIGSFEKFQMTMR